ncbi:hypothetical protein A2331_06670 [Candidatus Falkowbacteria bacterium RIFOXYB2_FULL_34_18]|uniref:CN hydrolase domain-containing protein n=1 Tax=Candidatus Falkowbacteria bacterium RIFOXYD2_FULL_34_120 TaxID=1798007 RepID=A0A1F5TRB0_9BACT|nr:MAG: hypothetical protein A2331_06670 [Candidatus Falkowbacteria bacterium RIFOXYB2_FULL_34_18]OGF29996.1 MAG: hypothetical protein A2500_04010 [Candidatus Falkowbacteria bacterium RIFOXYC12_FULL_34_55]OGF37147.1 MAG: hypothetical protein A2466_02510 [Candidatus Falkowbacteria bacterium RIFOXYC2_FULL_34_220]OGF39532.1 MAG: hypothetical protein A2515_04375 [Candidatus Falkowbacteria bacterium RIFOXYD12_FULL_34_57]OGF41485.1 MAG: hypothetical protein A2531_02225 [Candidatus Falkowbacteria bact
MNKNSFEKIKTSYKLPIISGVSAACSLLFGFFDYFIFVGLVPFFLFVYYEKSLVRLWLGSFLFYCIFNTMLGLFVVIEPLNWILMGLLFGFYGIMLGLTKKYFSPWFFWFLTPVLFVLLEYGFNVFNYIPGLPLALGNTLGSTIFLPLARIAGVWGLGLVVFIVNLLVCKIIIDWKNRRKWFFIIIAVLVFLVSLSGVLWIQAKNKKLADNINLAVISFSTKVIENSPEYKELGASMAYADSAKVNIFLEKITKEIIGIIPETADYVFLPTHIFNSTRENEIESEVFSEYGINNNGSIIVFARQLAKILNKNVITGIVTREYGKKYNSVLFFDRNGNLVDIYHKTNLVIGSEYWPFGDWVPFWMYWLSGAKPGQKLYIKSGFSRSETPFSVLKSENLNIGVLICSEPRIPGNFVKTKSNKAQIVFTPVNNDWYYGLGIAFFQKKYFNTLRVNSVYHDIPIIVNGKENYAGIIYPDGEYDIVKPEKDQKFNVWSGSLKY